MKRTYASNSACILAGVAILILAGSCLEYTVVTTVNADGSLLREYTVKGDSADIFKGSLMIPSGDPWQISSGFEHDMKQKDTTSRQYFYKASRKFGNVQELNQWLSSDTAAGTIKLNVNLIKHFRWFYTYFEYTEKYPMTFPFNRITVDSFLTDLEQSVLMEDGKAVYSPVHKNFIWKNDAQEYNYSHEDSVELKRITADYEKKQMIWMINSIIIEFSDIVRAKTDSDNSFADLKDLLSRNAEIIWVKVINTKDLDFTKMLVFVADSLTQSNKLNEFYENNPNLFVDFNRKIKHMDDIDLSDNYEYRLTMPGQVFSTNAFEQNLNQLTWKFKPMQFYMKDFEMQAESRVTNQWIMVFTGLLAALLVMVLLVKRKK